MQGGEETFLQTPLLPLRGYQHGHVDTPLPPMRGHPATPRRRSACVWGNVYLHVSRNTSASALSMRLGKCLRVLAIIHSPIGAQHASGEMADNHVRSPT